MNVFDLNTRVKILSDASNLLRYKHQAGTVIKVPVNADWDISCVYRVMPDEPQDTCDGLPMHILLYPHEMQELESKPLTTEDRVAILSILERISHV